MYRCSHIFPGTCWLLSFPRRICTFLTITSFSTMVLMLCFASSMISLNSFSSLCSFLDRESTISLAFCASLFSALLAAWKMNSITAKARKASLAMLLTGEKRVTSSIWIGKLNAEHSGSFNIAKTTTWNGGSSKVWLHSRAIFRLMNSVCKSLLIFFPVC